MKDYATSQIRNIALFAQMRPGAKVEKTYGAGLPRDMDRLLIPDSEYPVFPLKPESAGVEPLRHDHVPGAVASTRTRKVCSPSQKP